MKRKRAIEQRVLPLNIELRQAEGDDVPKLVGHAAVFNEWSTISDPWFGDLYEEQVAPGAFRKTIKEGDIRALWNHDPNIVLGRLKAGTLTLREDEQGLATEITPPDNEWGRPVLDAVKRGDVSGMSIAFQVVKEKWTHPDRKKEPEALRQRVIMEARLMEVSPVTFPAYPQTDIGARSEDNEDESRLLRAFRIARLAELGLPLDDGERAELRGAAQFLNSAAREPEVPSGDEPLWTLHSPGAQSNEPGTPVNAQDGTALQAARSEQPDVDHSEAARAREIELYKQTWRVR